MAMHPYDRPRPVDPDDARHRLAEATRLIIAELASSTASSEEFERARDLVEQAALVLAERGHGRMYERAEASLAAEHDESGAFLEYSPIVGQLNPLAPPIAISFEQDDAGSRVVGLAVFGDAYEGPPGCVHGGFIAAGFDEMLGFAQSFSGAPGMTAQLDVSYRSPTPLHREVRFVGHVERVEGRKIFTVATLHEGDRLCAEAQGLFISMKPEVFQRLMRSRAEPAG